MNAQANKKLVLEFYKLMTRLELEKMFDLMADDAIWSVSGDPSTFHHAGEKSKAERKQACLEFMNIFENMESEILSCTAEEDRVVLEARTRCRARSGPVYDQAPLLLFRCRDGKIVSIYESIDPFSTLKFEQELADAQIWADWLLSEAGLSGAALDQIRL